MIPKFFITGLIIYNEFREREHIQDPTEAAIRAVL